MTRLEELNIDLWDSFFNFHIRVITTNAITDKNGNAVMGKGIALQAKERYPGIEKKLGELLKNEGNHVFELVPDKLISFPVKNDWKDKANFELIERSCIELLYLIQERKWNKVVMVRPGCGCGGLDWLEVKTVVENLLGGYVVVTEGGQGVKRP